MTDVAAHLAIAPAKRDLDWLKSALQAAIALEHATMPPYIAATYSLKVQNYTAYNLLRGIVMEEMVHMASVCNILAALGGTPQIRTLDPPYPAQGLPGNAEPDLHVCLAQLSKRQLENFMRLESPLSLLPDAVRSEAYPSVASLYGAIRDALIQNAQAVGAAVKAGGKSNQVGDNIGFSTIVPSDDADCLDQMLAALKAITSQGEGCPHHGLHAGGASEGEESHYARFAQLYYGHQLRRPAADTELTRDSVEDFFRGYAIPFPEVVNTLAVPRDGYESLLAADPDRAAVEKDLAGFDQAYTDMLAGLEAVWNGDPTRWWPTLGQAVATMAKLRVLGCFNVMKHQVPAASITGLKALYPGEFESLAAYTRLDRPVFYGPRFRNLNVKPAQNS